MTSRLIVMLLAFSSTLFGQQPASPTEFLGESYGEAFTPHHRLVAYFQEVARNSDRMLLEQYGETNEGRPLYLAFVSSKENLQDIDNIRNTNLYNAGLLNQKPSEVNEKAIVWLSYSVHGNEAGGSEASMNVLYELLKDDSKQAWLDNTIVIIDPSLNPDGYERYTHWQRGVSGERTHPELSDVEHMEPWPGGRVNHYLFDLNRDWAWQTQVESAQRIAMYNRWLPHIHADLHEMGYDDHYYFAPAAEPYHKAITDYQRELQHNIGKNHAGYFDKNGWLYFTREIFDLLYPSYGDTWPTFNGSIGMTYEQAGHSMAGRSIMMSNGKELTLQDRIDHHTTTSLSTIEVASTNRTEIVNNFKSYFQQATEKPIGKYKHYLIKKSTQSDQFVDLLYKNGIQFSYVKTPKKSRGYSYSDGSDRAFQAEAGDIYVSAYQPKSTMLQVLMEEEPVLADSVTYDITSWCIPLAYDLECYGMGQSPSFEVTDEKLTSQIQMEVGMVGAVIPWKENAHARTLLGQLLLQKVVVKSVQKPTELGGVRLERGDLVVLSADQQDAIDWKMIVAEQSRTNKVNILPLNTGFATTGSDLGGSGFQLVEKPKVLTFFGDGVDANTYGQVWYYFEQTLDYPISRVDISRFLSVDFSTFNTIILPDGYYSLSDDQVTKLGEWVSNGGKLISIAGGNRALIADEAFSISTVSDIPDDSEGEQAERYKKRQYEGAERRSISGSIPGAIFKTELDPTHPLCYGIDSYFTLKNSARRVPLISDGYNPVFIPADYRSYGFIGSEIVDYFDDSSVFSVEQKGNGVVVYMVDNPLFRSFWKAGELIFANALFQVK